MSVPLTTIQLRALAELRDAAEYLTKVLNNIDKGTVDPTANHVGGALINARLRTMNALTFAAEVFDVKTETEQ